MKILLLGATFSCGVILTLLVAGYTQPLLQQGYILQKENEIGKEQSGPHNGGGVTMAYPFFSGIDDLKFVFRKRTLRAGSAIGYHLQKEDEIYYIAEGKGEMTVNGKSFTVSAGDAVLTRPGNSHGLKAIGTDSVSVIINYIK